MVVGQRRDAGAKTNAFGAIAEHRQNKLGRGNEFGARGVMFADPCFVVTQGIEMLDGLHIALDTQGRVFVDRMDRRNERAETKLSHCDPPTQALWQRTPTPPSRFGVAVRRAGALNRFGRELHHQNGGAGSPARKVSVSLGPI